jgi:hypothetical protein
MLWDFSDQRGLLSGSLLDRMTMYAFTDAALELAGIFFSPDFAGTFLTLLATRASPRFGAARNFTGDNRSTRGANLAPKEESVLAEFPIERGIRNTVLGNRPHWCLMVEVEDKENGIMYDKAAFKFQKRLMK